MNAQTIATFAFLIIALLLGGGGSRFAMQEMLVYLAAIPALALTFAQNNALGTTTRYLRPAKYFVLAVLFITVLQIVPLPPSIWTALPGQETLTEAAAIVGQADSWRAWSINPEKTLASGLYILVPATAFFAVSRLTTENQIRLIGCMVAVAAVHMLVSLGQSLSGGQSFYMYQTTHMGLPIGIFANRNHAAMMFLLCLILSPALLAARLNSAAPFRKMLFGVAALAFAIAILATSSRAITVLLGLSIVFIALISIPSQHRRKGVFAVLAGAIATIAVVLAAWWNNNLGSLQNLGERFQQSDDHRYEFWPETIAAAGQYFPFGSGIGTFDEAFRGQESLDIVGTHYVNHAHNDYIELIIENGIIGVFIVLALIAILIPAIRFIIRGHAAKQLTDLPLLGLLAVTAIAFHSLVDYPLRSLALAAMAGAIFAICLSVLGGRHAITSIDSVNKK